MSASAGVGSGVDGSAPPEGVVVVLDVGLELGAVVVGTAELEEDPHAPSSSAAMVSAVAAARSGRFMGVPPIGEGGPLEERVGERGGSSSHP